MCAECFSTLLIPQGLCKTRSNYQENAHLGHSEKSWLGVTLEKVVIFGVFFAIGAMVLPISPKPIELEGCACAQIKALVGWNRLRDPDDALDLLIRSKNPSNT